MKLQDTPTVEIVPMRRRHLRAVLKIEQQVYPRPWSTSLFLSELALRSSRAYFVARVGRDVSGWGPDGDSDFDLCLVRARPPREGTHDGRGARLGLSA